MTRKIIIDTLKAAGRCRLKGKDLEDCYTFELLIALRQQGAEENMREPG